MNPYYSDNLVTIYHGDALEVMPRVADVDNRYALITDPPYGVGMDAFADDFGIGCEGVNGAPGLLAAVFMSPRRTPAFVTAVPSWTFERLLWMHKNADIAAPWRGWSMNSEAIIVLSRHGAIWPQPTTYRTDTYTVGPWERDGHHPNAKPVAVVADLVARLASDIVLDPFMGSGTTLVAAKSLGRRAIGIEIDEQYCERAAVRCSQEVLGLAV